VVIAIKRPSWKGGRERGRERRGEREREREREREKERKGEREAFTCPQILMCNGGELAGGPTGSWGKCGGGPLVCGLCCGGGLYPTLVPPTFP